jgi:hypothetical protein
MRAAQAFLGFKKVCDIGQIFHRPPLPERRRI